MAKVLIIKIGLVETVAFSDGSILETAIRKKPVDFVQVHELGAVGNDVGLKAHHGGVDKALFFMSDQTFEKLTALISKDFDWKEQAIYGENFVVDELNEHNVCVGDRYQIGSVIVEVSQPRKPCDRLSKNTEYAETQHIIRETGLTGWYVRVIQTGEIHQGDRLELLARPYPQFSIMHLNRLLTDKATEEMREELEAALSCEKLAEAFKRSLRNQLSRI